MINLVPPETGSATLPDCLKWITTTNHGFKDLLIREVHAIEKELSKLESRKKIVTKARREDEKDYRILKLIHKSFESSLLDPPEERITIFKKVKGDDIDEIIREQKLAAGFYSDVEKKEESVQEDLQSPGFDESEDINLKNQSNLHDDDSEDERAREPAQDDDDFDEKGKGSDKKPKKRKYVILVKKCECCGLEAKRHFCRHTLCAKPCIKEEKQRQRKKARQEAD